VNKKNPIAMEFLLTYGWAIIVVLVAIGVLWYYGALSLDNLLPEKCEREFTNQTYTCADLRDAISMGIMYLPAMTSREFCEGEFVPVNEIEEHLLFDAKKVYVKQCLIDA